MSRRSARSISSTYGRRVRQVQIDRHPAFGEPRGRAVGRGRAVARCRSVDRRRAEWRVRRVALDFRTQAVQIRRQGDHVMPQQPGRGASGLGVRDLRTIDRNERGRVGRRPGAVVFDQAAIVFVDARLDRRRRTRPRIVGAPSRQRLAQREMHRVEREALPIEHEARKRPVFVVLLQSLQTLRGRIGRHRRQDLLQRAMHRVSGGRGVGDQRVDQFQAAGLDDVAQEVLALEEEARAGDAAETSGRTGDRHDRRQRQDPARLQHAAHLVGRVRDVHQSAEVLDRSAGEDAVEAIVGEAQPPRVHVLDDEAIGVAAVLRAPLGRDEHPQRRVELPDAGLHVAIDGHHLADVSGQIEDRVLHARRDAEDRGVRTQRAEVPQRPRGHRHFPVLAVLDTRGKCGPK